MPSVWKVLGGKQFREIANGERGGVSVARVVMQNMISTSHDVLDLLAVNEVRPGGTRRGNCKLSLQLDTWRRLLPVIQEALDAEVLYEGPLPTTRHPGGFQMPPEAA